MENYLNIVPSWMLITSICISIVICYAWVAGERGIKGVIVITVIFGIGIASVYVSEILMKMGSGWAVLFMLIFGLAFFMPLAISQLLMLFAPFLLIYFFIKKIRYWIIKGAIDSGEVISTKKFDNNIDHH